VEGCSAPLRSSGVSPGRSLSLHAAFHRSVADKDEAYVGDSAFQRLRWARVHDQMMTHVGIPTALSIGAHEPVDKSRPMVRDALERIARNGRSRACIERKGINNGKVNFVLIRSSY